MLSAEPRTFEPVGTPKASIRPLHDAVLTATVVAVQDVEDAIDATGGALASAGMPSTANASTPRDCRASSTLRPESSDTRVRWNCRPAARRRGRTRRVGHAQRREGQRAHAWPSPETFHRDMVATAPMSCPSSAAGHRPCSTSGSTLASSAALPTTTGSLRPRARMARASACESARSVLHRPGRPRSAPARQRSTARRRTCRTGRGYGCSGAAGRPPPGACRPSHHERRRTLPPARWGDGHSRR